MTFATQEKPKRYYILTLWKPVFDGNAASLYLQDIDDRTSSAEWHI